MSHRRYTTSSPHLIPWIIVSRLIGLAVYFIIVVVLARIQTNNIVLEPIISFFIRPAIIILVATFSLLFLVGEIFLALGLPLSLPGPFFNALGSVFLVSFLIQLLFLVDQISGITIFSLFRPLEPLLYFLVFLIVLIVQYMHLFFREGEDWRKRSPFRAENKSDDKGFSSPEDISWNEVEAEFRMTLYDFFHSIRQSFKKKE
jgi:hypothetical protein